MDAAGGEESGDRWGGGGGGRVAEFSRTVLFQPPATLDQAREEVARPCRQEGNDRGRPEIRERDRGDPMLDEGRPPETVGTLSPGLPDQNDAARWQSSSKRPCRPRPIVSESMHPRRATLRSKGSSRGSMNVPIRSSSLGNAPTAR